MSRRLADPKHPGLTAPISTSELRSTTTTTTTAHPPQLSTYASRDSGFGEHVPSLPTQSSSRPSSSLAYSELHLAPATRTSVVTTTTTTTVHFAPILIPRTSGAQPSSSRAIPSSSIASFAQLLAREDDCGGAASRAAELDPRMYPLSQAPWPEGMKKLKVTLGGLEGTFYDEGKETSEDEDEDETPDLPRRDKGKSKERASDASYNPPYAFSAPSRTERGANAVRRRSRRARPLSSHPLSALDPSASLSDDDLPHPLMSLEMDSGVDMGTSASGTAGARLPSPGPPRKRPRAGDRSSSVESDAGAARDNALFAAVGVVNPGALPSPNLSPPSPVPTFAGEDSQEDKEEAEAGNEVDFGDGQAVSGLLSLPHFVDMYDELTPAQQAYFLFAFLKRSSIPVLQSINMIIAPSLRRDFLTDLPPELGVQILGYLDAKTLCRAAAVAKGWRRLVDGEWRVWKERLVGDGLWVGDGSEEKDAHEIAGGSKENLFLKRWKAGVWDDASRGTWMGQRDDESMHVDGIDPPSPRRLSHSVKLASPSSSREASPFPTGHYTHPFKILYRRRFLTRRNWATKEPASVTFACHANNVVTCLQFDKDKIVSASDDHSINVFDTRTGATKAHLDGHEGGVWALQYIGNILVSGSTDRTVRVWDLERGKCTHVFVGHTSTVRCLQIVEPENVNPDPHGEPIWEPPYPLIVTGSRDWSLRVWKLPAPGKDGEYHPTVPMSPTEENTDPSDNPFHLRHLAGHRHAVRALAAHGRTLVSGSYDSQVRVWDMLTGECRHRLIGHSQKVYSVVFDPLRKQCASGSMDGTVRLWSTETGECRAVLEGHSSLVGLLGLSHRNLVSAAADSTLRIWDPATGECRHTLAAHSGAITCFQHDENKVVSGSDGTLKMWDVQSGTFTRDLLTGLTGVWQVSFDQRFCVAAVQRNGQSEFEILDFGPVDWEEREAEELELVKIEEETTGGGFERGDEGEESEALAMARRTRPLQRGAEFPRAGAASSGVAWPREVRWTGSLRNLAAAAASTSARPDSYRARIDAASSGLPRPSTSASRDADDPFAAPADEEDDGEMEVEIQGRTEEEDFAEEMDADDGAEEVFEEDLGA